MRAPLAALLIPALAAAAEPPPPVWQGVWQGQVGTLAVHACLGRDGDGEGAGFYYYLSRLRPIRLEQAGGSRAWAEGGGDAAGAARARWQFAAVGRDALSGTWSQGGRRLPFRLTRVAADDDEPCASAAFHRPRIRPLRVVESRATLAGTAYRRLAFDVGPGFDDVTLEAFALTGGDTASRRINARLRKQMPEAAEGSDWYQCVTGALASPGGGGSYEVRVAPTLFTPHWLAAAESVGYFCGGAHPDGGVTSLTFDRATGAEIDLHGWLSPAAVERRDYGTALRPAFRAAVLKQAGVVEAECREAVGEAEFWDIGLARAGLVFTADLPHVIAPCQEPVTMPWSTLTPWLSAAGSGAKTLAPH